MIRLYRNFTPAYLNPSAVRQMTDEYIRTRKPVWNSEEIKTALLQTSNQKCAFCETVLGRESKYMEVEHFYCKDEFPNLVAAWDNLLPSCRRCNGSKSNHNVSVEPIVNPYGCDPREHFAFTCYRIRPKTDVGKKSIEVLDLNNHRRAVYARFQIGEIINDIVDRCMERLELFLSKPTAVRRSKLISVVRALLDECQPTAAYAATSATILHNSDEYRNLVSTLRAQSLWDDELHGLHEASRELVLDQT
jgi:uncharacterized protein (TIGR02646 family)